MWFLQMNYMTWFACLALLISNGAFGLPSDKMIELLRMKLEGISNVVTSEISLLRVDISKNSLELERLSALLTLQYQNGQSGNISNDNNQQMAEKEQHNLLQNDVEELGRRLKRAFSNEKADMKQLMEEVRQEIGKFGSELKDLVDELRENQVRANVSIEKQFKDLQANLTHDLHSFLKRVLKEDVQSSLASSLETVSTGVTMVKDQCVENVQSLATSKFEEVSKLITQLGDWVEKGDAGVSRMLTELAEANARGLEAIASKVKNIEGVFARGKVRLVNITETADTMGGRLEVHVNDRWGTVCDDNFGLVDAKVACRALGFPGATKVKTKGYFGLGENDIWFDDVECDGSESCIFSCDKVAIGDENCNHVEDVGVICRK